MPFIIAALVLGAVSPPPPQDSDDRLAVDAAPSQRRDSAAAKPPANAAARTALQDDEKAQPSQGSGSDKDDDDEEGRSQPNSAIVVTAHRLDAARSEIDAGLGGSVYSLTNDVIENRPGGETGSLSEILTQAPGVTLSGRTLSVRGSSANQVRINNVILPEAISDPADLLSSRIAETTRLISGTLPAQFGFAPAGVISITTKNGLYQNGGQAELFAGSNGMIEPAFEWAGSAKDASLFASGELEHDRSRIADVEGNQGEDRRSGIDGLLFADHIIDQNNRISLIMGGSNERHRICWTSIGRGTQNTGDAYAVATYQHSRGGFTLQSSLFAGVGSNEADFAQKTRQRLSSWGTQIDASDHLGTAHILKFGLLASRSSAQDIEGGDRSTFSRTSIAVYGADEWKLAPSLTFNPGARIEWLRGSHSGAKIEPRASLVWKSGASFSAHVGYARYASAPPPGEHLGARLADELDDYFDAGLEQKVGAFTLGVDAYLRTARHYIAEHSTPGSAIDTAFEFKRARMKGIELSGIYAHRGTTAWTNLSLSRAEGRTIISGDLFEPEAIEAAAGHYLPLASDRPLVVSGGITQRVARLSLGADVLISSGAVRTLTLTNPNGARHPAYALLGVSAVYHTRIASWPADLRLDVTNLTNAHYASSDAANLEGGWTQLGRGPAVTIGIEQGF